MDSKASDSAVKLEPEPVAPGPSSIQSCRRFGLGDLMILIGALAVALGVSIPIVHGILGMVDMARRSGGPVVIRPVLALFFANNFLFAFVFALIPAAILIRLRRPRPAWSVLLAQPGFVGCLAAVLAFLLALGVALLTGQNMQAHLLLPPAIPAAWAYLALTRRWRRGAGWIDAFTMALSLLFVATTVILSLLVRLV